MILFTLLANLPGRATFPPTTLFPESVLSSGPNLPCRIPQSTSYPMPLEETYNVYRLTSELIGGNSLLLFTYQEEVNPVVYPAWDAGPGTDPFL